jgi:hypothetical protein
VARVRERVGVRKHVRVRVRVRAGVGRHVRVRVCGGSGGWWAVCSSRVFTARMSHTTLGKQPCRRLRRTQGRQVVELVARFHDLPGVVQVAGTAQARGLGRHQGGKCQDT